MVSVVAAVAAVVESVAAVLLLPPELQAVSEASNIAGTKNNLRIDNRFE